MNKPIDLIAFEHQLNPEPLTPLKSSPNSVTGAQLEYWTHPRHGKRAPRLSISIRPDLLNELGFSDGDNIRIDADIDKKAAVMVLLDEECPTGASRRIKVRETGRGVWTITWNGSVLSAFPANNRTELEIIGHRPGAVFFKLP